METDLRPRTLGELLDRTAELYRGNFLLFAGIFAMYCGVALVLGLLQIGLGEALRMAQATERLQWLTWTFGGIAALLDLLLLGVAVAAISRAVAWVNLGQPATIRAAYLSVWPDVRRYLWLMTLTGVLIYTPIGLLYGGLFLTMSHYIKGYGTMAGVGAQQAAMSDPATMAAVGVVFGVFALLFFPVAIYTVFMALRYALALPACVVEGLTAWQAMRRGIQLSKGARWRILVLGLLIGAIKLGLMGLTQLFFIASFLKHNGEVSALMLSLSQLVGFFTNSFLGPIGAAGITLFYFDQRIRKEGFDIEWMMQAAGMTVPVPQTIEAEIAPGMAGGEFESGHENG